MKILTDNQVFVGRQSFEFGADHKDTNLSEQGKKNLCEFFDLLLNIDKRVYPENYKNIKNNEKFRNQIQKNY